MGAGQQRVRFAWASVGVFHLRLWTFALTEAWAWGRPADDLVDRSESQWGSPLRRPSHADKRRAWRRAPLGEEFRAVLRPGVTEAEIQAQEDCKVTESPGWYWWFVRRAPGRGPVGLRRVDRTRDPPSETDTRRRGPQGGGRDRPRQRLGRIGPEGFVPPDAPDGAA